ncbi:hypothetical protein K505DRAFT_112997 [Melanomma pulvis-pyrius CBS 109.77]|uniref:Uncharacterized protein n=1 Tax=Melanomma pulvis-pyrius CBS 109.77 TaxID=1314802 RepID=A0A6A6WVT7_9PLEO|nr:hypothetical protein K505DRAFT_112997 [Melanomma pulvis-pyrius CBS 109.77]
MQCQHQRRTQNAGTKGKATKRMEEQNACGAKQKTPERRLGILQMQTEQQRGNETERWEEKKGKGTEKERKREKSPYRVVA